MIPPGEHLPFMAGFCIIELFNRGLSPIAYRYARLHDPDAALDHFEKGFLYAEAYDELPQTKTHTSFLVRGNVYDKRKTGSMSGLNQVIQELQWLLDSSGYQELKDTERMKALVAGYQPFCGEKTL